VSLQTAGKSIKCPQCDRRLRVPKDAVQRRRAQITSKAKHSPNAGADIPTVPNGAIADPEPPPVQHGGPASASEHEPPAIAPKEVASELGSAKPTASVGGLETPHLADSEPSQTQPSDSPARASTGEQPQRHTPPPLPKQRPRVSVAEHVARDDDLTAPISPPLDAVESDDSASEELEVAVQGYQPDHGRVATVRWLACALALIALFGLIPAGLDMAAYFQSETSTGLSRWASTLLLVGALQLAYAAYLVQLPDWSSVWVVTVLSLLVAGGYAAMCGLTFLASEQSHFVQMLELADRLRGGKASGWCLIMLLLTSLLSYFSARIAGRWQQAFEA